MRINYILLLTVLCFFCFEHDGRSQSKENKKINTTTLPPPHATKSKTNFSKVQGWKDGRAPIAPEGFTVSRYAEDFENPRWMYVTPNGDVL